MKINKIESVLNRFIDSNSRSILIEGPWGSGKTYQVKKFLESYKRKKKQKVIYVSLFGKNNTEEINFEVYKKIHPKKFVGMRMLTAFTNIAAKTTFPFDGLPLEQSFKELNFAINDIKENISGNHIIIFDDLERVSETFSYVSFLGYINQLYLKQVRVVFVSSPLSLVDNKKEKEFEKFKEKIIDRVYHVRETNHEVIKEMFKKHKINNIDLILPKFKNNLRNAQKTSLFFNEVINVLEKNKLEYKKDISLFTLLEYCMEIIQLSFGDFIKPTKIESYEKVNYERDIKAFGEPIANGIYSILNNQELKHTTQSGYIQSEPTLKHIKRSYLIMLFKCYSSGSYEELITHFKSREINDLKKDLLDKDFYYLSDENKLLYTKTLLERMKNYPQYFYNENYLKLVDTIKYGYYEFSQDEREKIIYLIIDDKEKDPEQRQKHLKRFRNSLMNVPSVDSRVDEVKIWKETITKIINEESNKSKIKLLQEANENNDIDDLSAFFKRYEYDLGNNNKLVNYITKNNFFLPNLKGDITQNEWSFSHEMARFSLTIDKSDEFIKMLKNLCKENKGNNSLIDRCKALVKHNMPTTLNIEDIDENYN